MNLKFYLTFQTFSHQEILKSCCIKQLNIEFYHLYLVFNVYVCFSTLWRTNIKQGAWGSSPWKLMSFTHFISCILVNFYAPTCSFSHINL